MYGSIRLFPSKHQVDCFVVDGCRFLSLGLRGSWCCLVNEALHAIKAQAFQEAPEFTVLVCYAVCMTLLTI